MVAKSKAWYIHGQSTTEETQLEYLTSLNGMKQLVVEAT